MFFLLSTREVFIIKLLSQNHKSALFWLIFFFSKNPKIPKKFLIGKISLPSPFLLKSVCEKRLGHIVTNKFTKLRNKFEVSWKPIICFIIPLHCGKKIGDLQIIQSTQHKFDILSGANYIRKFSWPEQKFLAGEINNDRQWIHKLLIFAAYSIHEYCCSNHLNFCSWINTEIQIYVGYYKIFVGSLSSFRNPSINLLETYLL